MNRETSHSVPTHAAQQSLDWSNLRVTIVFQIMEKLVTRISLELSFTIHTYIYTIFAKIQPNVQRNMDGIQRNWMKLNSIELFFSNCEDYPFTYACVSRGIQPFDSAPTLHMPWHPLGPLSPCRWDDKRPWGLRWYLFFSRDLGKHGILEKNWRRYIWMYLGIFG